MVATHDNRFIRKDHGYETERFWKNHIRGNRHPV